MRSIAPTIVRCILALALVAATARCGKAQGPSSLDPGNEPPAADPFPPMANDHAPGASAAARAAAAGLARGVNFGNMLEAPSEGAWGLWVRDEYVDAAASAGFKSVRLPVRWSNHTAPGSPYGVDPAFMAHVDSIVGKLLDKGLYVVLNMHHYRALDGDTPDAGDVTVDPAKLDERFLTIWQQIAQRFRDRGDHLVFELYNEPHGRLTAAKWNDLAARALGVVRKTNPTRVVMIGPVSWNSADALASLRLPNDANLIVTVHNYSPFNFTHQGAEWVSPVLPLGVTCCSAAQQNELAAPLETARKWAAANDYPVYLGEFGAYQKADMTSRVRFTRLMRDAAESRGITWGYWEMAAGFGVYDPAAHTFRVGLRDALLGSQPVP
ncbi:MAG TPA: glycoside hydrolase family 5 protein [Longimicrobiales bacterium]